MSGNQFRIEVGSLGIVLLSPTQKGGYRQGTHREPGHHQKHPGLLRRLPTQVHCH
jgi:hypothetical protein